LASLGHPCKFQRVSGLGSVIARRHSSIGCQPDFAALNRGRHLYSAGWPSRWALAHISSLVIVFGRPFVKRFALCYQTVVLSVCLSCLSVTLLYSGQTVGWIEMKLDMEVGLGPGHIVLDGDPVPSPWKGAQFVYAVSTVFLPPFSAYTLVGLREVGLSPGDFVLYGDPVPSPPKGAEPPNFRPMSIVGKRLHGSRCRLVRR